MIGVLLQVRLDSNRLPCKALLSLKEKSVIEHACIALRRIEADLFCIVTDKSGKEFFQDVANKQNYKLYCGAKRNVLKRYVAAAREFGIQTIIRATGDNPLVSFEAANSLLKDHKLTKADYSAYRQLPLGCGVEVVELNALENAYKKAKNSYDCEHVTSYIYSNPEYFTLNIKNAPEEYRAPELRVTLDTISDYKYLHQIFGDLYSGGPISIRDLISWYSQ